MTAVTTKLTLYVADDYVRTMPPGNVPIVRYSHCVSASEYACFLPLSIFQDAKTLIIEDSGVGMTKDELKQNLGRIAESGTAKFMDAIKQVLVPLRS